MLYSYFVKKLVRQSFDHVNNHRWDELLRPVAPNVHHRFAGAHSIINRVAELTPRAWATRNQPPKSGDDAR